MAVIQRKLIGIFLIVAGPAVFGARALWSATRTFVPVSVPVSLTIGHIRSPVFKINLRSRYLIQIEAHKKIPYDILNCLMGVGDEQPQRCKATPSVIDVSWVLSSKGAVVSRGSSENNLGGAWTNDSVARQIGSFISEPGRLYRLDLDVLQDGKSLNPAEPRLRIEVHPSYYEGSALQDLPFLLATALSVVFGAMILLIGTRGTRKS